MKIDFSYKWYRKTCKDNDLDPEHPLATFYIEKAKQQSRKMKYYMDALKQYEDDEIASVKIQHQIEYHNNLRIESMLDALKAAEGRGIEQELIE